MKNKKLLWALPALFVSVAAYAAVRPFYQDVKLPTQQMVEKQTIENADAANDTAILNAHAGNTSTEAVVVTTFDAQPDVPRTIRITAGGSTNDVAACDIVVAGTNYLGEAISETIHTVVNQVGTKGSGGVKAFSTLTSVTFPANCEDSPFAAAWSVGFGESLGVKRCLDAKGHIFHSTLDGTKEATAPTMVVDADEVEKNTADFNGTMDGSADFELFFMQNFQCVN